MQMLYGWEQTAVFNPADPTQKKIETYTGVPGGYSSFYFNRVKPAGSLMGLRGTSPITWRSLAIYSLVAVGGWWAMKKTGLDKPVKRTLRKIPIVKRLPGLAGRRR